MYLQIKKWGIMLFSKNILSKNYRRNMEKLFIDER